MNSSCKKEVIKSSNVLKIVNKLRMLGLRPSMNGTKLINKCVQHIITSKNEFYKLEDVFKEIIVIYPELNPRQMRSEIRYALNKRNEKLSEKNFEKIFGYEYDEDIFQPKEFIDEFVYMILEYKQ